MRRFLRVLFLALCLAPVAVSAEEIKKEKYLEWYARDLYYHDADGTIVQMELAPKLSVVFTREMTKEDKAAFLAQFSPIAEMEQPGDSSRTLLQFQASITPAALLETANKMSVSGKVEAYPVFFVDNIEAVLEGMVVEPKIVLTPNRLQERMQKYGNFAPRQILNENGTWVFLVDEVRPPLNLLVLMNLFSKDSWVKRAYPRFKFLHDPIIASIVVEPVSGTVAEVRTVTFTIKIFDPMITLSTERLPEFGRGLFMPIQGSPSSPPSVRYPPGYLFELMGDPVRPSVRQDRRSRTYMTSWKFKYHALGEWTIHPQTVSYAKNGVDQEIKSSGFTIVVNSQIGSLKITDMPVPRSLIHPYEKPAADPEVKLPPVPSYWFDAWLTKPELVARYAWFAGIFLGILVLGSIGFILGRGEKIKWEKTALRRGEIGRIRRLLEEASATSSYAKYEDALSAMLVMFFPHLTYRPTWEEIKDDQLVLGILGDETIQLLESVFTELGYRHRRAFSPTADGIAELDGNIRVIFATVKRTRVFRKEAS